MGSFLLRQYLTMYADGLAGAIIMGTGEHSMAELNMGRSSAKGLRQQEDGIITARLCIR